MIRWHDHFVHGAVYIIEMCDYSYSCMKATHTKDMCIHNNKVVVVYKYIYLGTTIDRDRQCGVTYKKYQQQLYCLKKRRF